MSDCHPFWQKISITPAFFTINHLVSFLEDNFPLQVPPYSYQIVPYKSCLLSLLNVFYGTWLQIPLLLPISYIHLHLIFAVLSFFYRIDGQNWRKCGKIKQKWNIYYCVYIKHRSGRKKRTTVREPIPAEPISLDQEEKMVIVPFTSKEAPGSHNTEESTLSITLRQISRWSKPVSYPSWKVQILEPHFCWILVK